MRRFRFGSHTWISQNTRHIFETCHKKHAQTIGVLERAHATIETFSNMASGSGEYRKQWHKHLPIETLNCNTTHHSNFGCEPSRVLHGRFPHNILDHKLGLRFNPNIAPKTDFADEILRRILCDETKKRSCSPTSKPQKYYKKKAKAYFLRDRDYCFILQLKADHQGSKTQFCVLRWIGRYIVETVLPNKNYLVQQFITRKRKSRIRSVSKIITLETPWRRLPGSSRSDWRWY